MAIFDTARLRGVMVRGEIASEPAADEFVQEVEAQVSEALAAYGTLERMELMEARLLAAMAELRQQMAELEARAAEREARHSRHLNQAVGIVLGGIAVAVGIILGFG